MVFNPNVSTSCRDEIGHMRGCAHQQQYEKYTSLLPIIGCSKKLAFEAIKTKVWKKLQFWNERLLSLGDKEILIKVAALPILTYAISCFKFPTSFCDELEFLMARF